MKEQELRDLLADMSLDEKIGQMLQLTGNFFSDDGLATGPMADMNLCEEQVNNTGSILSTVGAAKLRDIQDRYMKKQPHNIPLMFMADVINGYRTVFPIPLAQGCSFNPDLSEKMASIAAKESARAGLHVTFSPMVDLVRDARWGRVMESTGEDVYLNGQFARAMVNGYQGDSIGDKDKISACIKHFAGYGAPVAGRDYNQVELSERTLSEDYMPAYKEGIDAGARMVMTSFNTLGRIPSTGNKKLMRDVLRDEYGFDGVLISDWAAIQELIPHGVAKDASEAAFLGVQAGVDIDMVTNIYINNLKALVEEGKVPEKWIDECTYRILSIKNELGLFENPYKDADEEYDEQSAADTAHIDFARKALPETFVLLKNDGILPLKDEAGQTDKNHIAFIGPYMYSKDVCGSWTLFNNKEDNVTLAQGIEDRKLTTKYTVDEGCTTLAPCQHMAGFQGPVDNPVTEEELEKMMATAVEHAANADLVVLALGEHNQMTGEGGSRTEIGLPEHQLELFRRVVAVNPNVVVVNFSGRPMDLREISKKSRALLQVWFPGTQSGHAVMDVLFGDASPSGRLSMSFPFNVGQVPVYYSEFHTGRMYYNDDNRFTSRYIDAPNKPLYVFGYGLDYTEYKYSNIKLSSDKITDDCPITVSVDVTNTGDRAGKEVVQMYIQDMVGSVVRPLRQLKGFKKMDIAAGETVTVSFEISTDMLKFYDIDMNYVVEPGDFKVYIGHDSDADLAADFKY